MLEKNPHTKIKYIIMAIHALLTFVFARLVLRNIGYNPSGTKVVNDIVSVKTETVTAYVFSEIFALIIIYCLWTLVFYVINNFKKAYILFIAIYVVGIAVLFLLWPEVFTHRNMHMDDNLTTYATAIRLTPDYWHSFYLSIVYAATMLVLPLRFSISLFQWSVFMFALAYIFFRADNYSGKLKYLIFTVFLFPNALEFITYSHRICMYMSVLAIYIAVITFDMADKRQRKPIDYIWIAAFAAFLSVWRSEGIIIGALTFIIYVLYFGQKKIKSILLRLLIFAGFYLIILIPQKIGDIKYYGNDYPLMNSFDTLYYILNSDEADLKYDGAAEDLAAIDKVVPLQLVKEYSTEGYRSYNVNVRGNSDINQSMIDSQTSDRYTQAYHNILKHNPFLTVKIKAGLVFKTLGFKSVFGLQEFSGEHEYEAEWKYGGWDVGYSEYYLGNFIMEWRYVPLKFRIAEKTFRLAKNYFDFTFETGIYGITAFGLILLNAVIGFKGLIEFIKKKNSQRTMIGLITLVNLMSFSAIALVIPAPAYIYFFPSFCVMTIMIYMYLICKKQPE